MGFHWRVEPWVQNLLGACIRVGGGTGFLVRRRSGARIVLTAQHVVGEQHTVSARWAGGQGALQVIHADAERDIAVLDAIVALDANPALRLATVAPEPGDAVAYAGYPTGWNDLVAVLQRGWIAASGGQELWFDGNANPGNSGGPVTAHEGNEVVVAGVLLGRAGNVEDALSTFQRQAKATDEAAQRFHFPMTMGGMNVIDDMLRLSTRSTLNLSILLDRHFRTGLVRAASLTRIAEVLGAE